jgi:2-enoate reductase
MKLFEPGTIGRLLLKNRIVMPAINIQLASPVEESWLTQRGIDFYAARAKGGAGLIITTFMRPNRKLEPSIGEPVISSHLARAWLSDLTDAVHDYGAKICIQLSPGLGRISPPKPNLPDGGLVAPSQVPSIRSRDGKMPSISPGRYPAQPENYVITRELTTEEIDQLIKDYEFSAEVIKDAGIDAIEIHGHQGYLLDEFMTALWNKRTDKYGGSLEGRLRLPIELIKAIKRAAGTDFPVIFRYGLTHYLEGARDIKEGLEVARRLEAAGIDAISVNAGCYETYNIAQPPTTQPRGCWVELAKMTKEVVNIPVIVAGKLGYPDLAESVLQEGKADFIGLARYLLADPNWPNKVKEGRTEDIIPCLGCHEGCIARVRQNKHISCAVNPSVGLERDSVITPAEKKKSVLVIGGGPAGMEAARVSAIRGHKVSLWEKGNALGGNLIPAAVPAFKNDYKLLIDYLVTQINKLGVSIELGREATPELIWKMKPDIVFVATGAKPIIPKIKGVKEGLDTGKVLTAVDLLLGKKEAGKSVVIIGGGLIGCETALYLAKEKGKKVTIIELLDSIARDMVWGNALDLVRELDENKVKIMSSTNVLGVADSHITIADEHGKKSTVEADTIVLAVGLKSNRELVEALKNGNTKVYAIGDCVEPCKVIGSMWQGFRTARLV